jgi:hypothetical protein
MAKKYLVQTAIGAFLREHGYPYGDSTITKLCSPAINQGPPIEAYQGKRPLRTPEKIIAWAEGRLRHVQPANTDIEEEAAEQEASEGVGPEHRSRRHRRRGGELASSAPRPAT